MRPVAAWLIYLAVVLVGGGLLAPWLYWATQAAGAHWPLVAPLAEHPFHRFVLRSMLALALLGIYPLVRFLGFNRWRDVGLPAPFRYGRPLRAGFLIGLISLAAVALLILSAGARRPDLTHTLPQGLIRLVQALLTAAVVAFLEEVLFRGTLFGALRSTLPWRRALVISSFVFALVHFFQKPDPPATVLWTTGVQILGQMLDGFWHPHRLAPEFLTLFLVGGVLALAYQKTGNLYFSIGLHAGWIVWLRLFDFLTESEPDRGFRWLWGSGKLIDGWLATLVLGLVFVWLWHTPQPPGLPRVCWPADREGAES